MNTININNLFERSLHPFLNYYLRNTLNIAAKTIYQERSTNTTKGENAWIHPDMVGYSITTSNWNEKVVSLTEQYNMPKVVLYSFELKKEITMSSLREVFFQAVSNSSWSNEGYLVAANISMDDEKLMKKMSRLSNSFGIGIIKLNLENPVSSDILFPAQRRNEIDGDTVNHLFEINKDFRDFLNDVEKGIKINRVVDYHLDEVKTLAELREVLASEQEDSTTSENVRPTNIHGNTNDPVGIMDWSANPTGTKPKEIVIDGQEYPASTWKSVYITFCQFLCRTDLERFKKIQLKGKKRDYFSTSDKGLAVPYYLDEADLYMEVNLNALTILKNIRTLMEEFDINLQRAKIILEKN